MKLPRLHVLGTVLAAIAYQQSLAPTLMSREWYFQGVVTGVAMTIAYLVGTLLRWVGRSVIRAFGISPRPLSPRGQRVWRGIWIGGTAAFVLFATVQSQRQQQWTWERLGGTRDSAWLGFVGTLLVAAAVILLLWGAARLIRWVRQRVTWLADLVLPRWAAGVVAVLLVGWLLVFSLNNWVYQRALDGLNQAFTLSDGDIEEEVTQPVSELRTGGPGSTVDWEGLGREGRRFLDRGADVSEIAARQPAAVTDEAIEPIRVFVGRANAQDVEERAAMALAELERTGAFEREAVLVVIPTGTGWINEQLVQPLEYFYSGDVATVAMQYSHLPSPIAFLAEEEAAQEAGRALIGAVSERLEAMPEDERPTLLVTGESLGSFGGTSAFDDLGEMVAAVDASLWVGPPASVEVRRQAERERVEGSLQISPVWREDDSVIFPNRTSEIVAPESGSPVTSVFLQQADDAILWWEPEVAWSEPDWLKEPLDDAVNPDMEWYPISTFLNLAVDMAVGTAFDQYQGHMYGTQPAHAWRLMLADEEAVAGWSEAEFETLLEHLRTVERG